MTTIPTVTHIQRHSGIAGQFSVSATVAYPYEAPETITFIGSTYGGTVVMVTPYGAQTFVTDPGRFGIFGTDWVRRFFGTPE
jgi:hypothetical protein